MADVWAEVVEFTAATGTGNSDISMSVHSGDTPKAVMFYMVRATANDTNTDHANFGWGVADDTNNGAVSSVSTHATANSECDRWANFGAHGSSAGHCIGLVATAGGSLEYGARFVSLGAGKCTINTVTAAGSAWKGVAVFFGGGDLVVDVGKLDMPADAGTVTATPGFETTICFMGSTDMPAAGGFSSYSYINFGAFAYNNPTITQANIAGRSTDGQTSCKNDGTVHNAECFVDQTAGSANYAMACTSVTSTQFVLTHNGTGNEDLTDDLVYLALGGTGSTWVELFNPSASTGTAVAYTPIGFESEVLGFMPTLQVSEATNNATGDSTAGSFGWGVADYGTDGTDGTSRCGSWMEEDASPTMDTSSLYATKLWKLLDDSGGTTSDWDCTLVSIDATGWTMNQSSAAGSASAFFLGWAIEKGVAPAAGNPGKTNPLFGRSPLRGPIT